MEIKRLYVLPNTNPDLRQFCYMDADKYLNNKDAGWRKVTSADLVMTQPLEKRTPAMGDFIKEYVSRRGITRNDYVYIQPQELIILARERFGVTLRAGDLGVSVVSLRIKKIGSRKMWQFPRTWI